MANEIKFTKMHGTGNDYIYVDITKYPIADPEKKAVEWSKFHTGIGSDGLILIGSSDKADFSMRIFNADGSEALMCGNGSRCVGKYVYEYGLTRKTELTLDTLSGIKILKLHLRGETVDTVTVDMGTPAEMRKLKVAEWFPYQSTQVSMGNPHVVTFVKDIAEEIDLPTIGPKIEHLPLFPDRTNVEFAQLVGKDTIRMRVWERGSGITQACGTGACATAVAASLNGLAGRKSDIIMDGGTVSIEWDEATDHVLMTGPATKVFDGVIEE
ncbi:MAG: diaminopimelate epimerase [Mediterranea sp.]|jgi:diaminopimelate epimerase|nr:diaminopimelate epimerase [Mediterranea sp.]